MHVKGHSPHYASGWGLKMFEIVHVLDVKGKTRGKGILACVTQWFLRGAGEGAQGVGTDEALPLNQGGATRTDSVSRGLRVSQLPVLRVRTAYSRVTRHAVLTLSPYRQCPPQ